MPSPHTKRMRRIIRAKQIKERPDKIAPIHVSQQKAEERRLIEEAKKEFLKTRSIRKIAPLLETINVQPQSNH